MLELGEINKDLVYTPVEPCRIVDTRLTAAGPIPTEGTRTFNVYGSVPSQGGNPAGCPSPRGELRAVHMNVVAVRPTSNGTLRAFPHGIAPPTASLVNYTTNTTIANGATVQTCCFCGSDITFQSRFASANVVIDVLGYNHKANYHGTRYFDHRSLNTRSINVGTSFSRIDNFQTFNKLQSTSNVEVLPNTIADAGTFAGGCRGVVFQVRFDTESSANGDVNN